MIKQTDFFKSTTLTAVLATAFTTAIFAAPSLLWNVATMVSSSL